MRILVVSPVVFPPHYHPARTIVDRFKAA